MVVVVGLVAKSCPILATPWTVARQAPLSMGFPRQDYWNGSPFLSPGDLPNSGIELWSPELQADSLSFEPQGDLFTLEMQVKEKEHKTIKYYFVLKLLAQNLLWCIE